MGQAVADATNNNSLSSRGITRNIKKQQELLSPDHNSPRCDVDGDTMANLNLQTKFGLIPTTAF